MTEEEVAEIRSRRTRQSSLRYRMVFLLSGAMFIIAVVSAGICFLQFHQETIGAQTRMGESITSIASDSFDHDRVEEYMSLGEAAPGYIEAEELLTSLLNSSQDIEYVYVYQIREDGCHVVFDPDKADEPGSNPGEVIPFDEDFKGSLDDLLKGKEIEPVISNGQYGWLYTIYTPVRDSSGNTVCYAGVDISMESLMKGLYAYLAKVLSLFLSIIGILLAVFMLLAESGVIMPINSMALATSRFAYDSAAVRNDSLDQIDSLGIRTGDEIENLYHAITQTSGDSIRYIAESNRKNETIARMQENLILVLADMVESRDQFTGDHVKNTSEYTLIIMEQLKKEGIYTDQLTDEFVRNVYHSAPLHDIGKIRVPDSILNKPGKLTDEEFETMKLHTIYGRDVIEKAKKASSDVSYLNEAENLSLYHHEKWNGKGYPHGLSGEDIPLSARIMAVADVFDALVSKRSYKDPFPFEKAMDIIREGAGNHFDPNVAGAFMHAEDKVRRVLGERRAEEK